MARPQIPDPLTRRHLLAGELDAARGRAIADAYLEQERAVEAIAFLEKIGDTAGLETLCERAVSQGDGFLLREASAALKRPIEAALWTRLAEAAAGAGKDAYAEEARRQAARPAVEEG